MNNTYSLDQKHRKTGDHNADLIMRQYKSESMAKFMEIKSVNPRLKQDQIAKELGCLSRTSQRYRKKINKLSP